MVNKLVRTTFNGKTTYFNPEHISEVLWISNGKIVDDKAKVTFYLAMSSGNNILLREEEIDITSDDASMDRVNYVLETISDTINNYNGEGDLIFDTVHL